MDGIGDRYLARLSEGATVAVLGKLGLTWSPEDAHLCAALRFKLRVPDGLQVVGLIGGASSGKSTLFNSLLGQEVSQISAHAHETLGPIVTVPANLTDRVKAWVHERLLFPDCAIDPAPAPAGNPIPGRVGAISLLPCQEDGLERTLLVDMPDVTSQSSAEEGAIARGLAPFFDGIIVVVDEERWYDASVFDETVESCRNYKPRVWIVFNRTEQAEPLSAEDHARLAEHARNRGADDFRLCPFVPGCGYRPVDPETRQRLREWLALTAPPRRRGALQASLARRAAAVVSENVARAQAFARMTGAVEKELARVAEDVSLTRDLLTEDEKEELIDKARQYIPLYDVFRTMRKKIGGLGFRRWTAANDIDFEKRPGRLAEVLQRNLELRFRRAADRVDALAAESGYLADEAGWKNTWTLPAFDAGEWARRVRGHIESWKRERGRQARQGDVAALSVSVPLLLADILFLGGAGVTLTWAGATIASFLGGKGVAQLVQRSRAFEEYRTTVGAYQTLLHEALTEQWRENLARAPRRHLKMTDPLLEALMSAATPPPGKATPADFLE